MMTDRNEGVMYGQFACGSCGCPVIADIRANEIRCPKCGSSTSLKGRTDKFTEEIVASRALQEEK